MMQIRDKTEILQQKQHEKFFFNFFQKTVIRTLFNRVHIFTNNISQPIFYF